MTLAQPYGNELRYPPREPCRSKHVQLANFTLFLSVTFVVSASPGPVMLSCMSNGGRYGLKKAARGMLGASLGNLLLMALSALGLGLLVSQHAILFNAIKWLGAGYLIYMGIQIIRKPVTSSTTDHRLANPESLLLNSFIIALSNPKGFIYFGALIPQFIQYQEPLLWQFSLLACVFLFTDVNWMLIYAAAGQKIMQWLKTPAHQYRFNLVSGMVLIAAGTFMAFSGRIE